MKETSEFSYENLLIQKKRKFYASNEQKNITSGPIDMETNQRGVFPEMIDLDNSSENDNDPPFDGVSYLKQVRIEARQRPGIMIAHLPQSVLTKSIQIVNKTIAEEMKLEKKITMNITKPYSLIWQEKFLKKFIALRTSFNSLKVASTLFSLPKNKIEWHKLLFETLQVPTLTMLCSIDQYTVLNLLKWNTGWLSYNSPQQQVTLYDIFSIK
ncbi:hypothetical protein PMAC_000643 [Pneumocystis sp. 'macacae']|nr:hypothetical protein PMAC_000643 [Pneumocystis sp. 'macacae']